MAELEILFRSFYVSFLGATLALILAVPLAFFVFSRSFFGRGFLILFMQSLMALPPVLVGLCLYMLFRPDGAFGVFNWLYSPQIMILAQFVLVFPIIFSLAFSAFEDRKLVLASFFDAYPPRPFIVAQAYFFECRLSLLMAYLTGFGRAIGEVGAVLIVGGNIAKRTELMTTVIIEETGKGNLSLAISMGVVLLVLALGVSLMGAWLRRNMGRET